ncbi:MAG: hypothetical protein Q7S05_01740, partial [bacterium]|nr:hypothetical protein [bacterium]
MTDEITFDGVRYILAAEAGRSAGLTRDYISRLCREGKVTGKQIGKNWYVNKTALQSFLLVKEHEQLSRSQELANRLAQEYKFVQRRQNLLVDYEARERANVGNEIRKENGYSSGGSTLLTTGNFLKKISEKTTKIIPAASEHLRVASHAISTSSSGAADAAMRIAPHVSLPVVTPTLELAHKLTALFVAAMLTFGTYSVVDPAPARTAYESMKSAGRGIAQLPA